MVAGCSRYGLSWAHPRWIPGDAVLGILLQQSLTRCGTVIDTDSTQACIWVAVVVLCSLFSDLSERLSSGWPA
jgi:hypothetical protein